MSNYYFSLDEENNLYITNSKDQTIRIFNISMNYNKPLNFLKDSKKILKNTTRIKFGPENITFSFDACYIEICWIKDINKVLFCGYKVNNNQISVYVAEINLELEKNSVFKITREFDTKAYFDNLYSFIGPQFKMKIFEFI